MELGSEFYSNLGARTIGNVFLVVCVGVGWWVKNKCKHSKSRCGYKEGCCQISFQEDSIQKKETERKQKTEEQLLNLLKKLNIVPENNPENNI